MLMNSVDQDAAAGLWDECDSPCLSLFQPTHRNHPDNQQDPIRFTNLVKELEKSLQQQFSTGEIDPLLEPLWALADDHDFWNCTFDGLAVLRTRNLFRVYRLQRPVAELAVVADSFHTKPLLRILQSADRYQVLALNRHEVKLFEGNRDALDEIEPADGVPRTLTEALGEELTDPRQTVSAYGGRGGGQAPMHHGHGGRKDELDHDAERFFRAVDRAVLEHHSKPSGLPLILAALPEHHHMFHELSHNPFLIAESLGVHPDALASLEAFRDRVWRTIEPRYLARLAALVETFGSKKAKGLAADDLAEVARAAVGGRVATLLVEARREIPGRVDASTGELEFDDLSNPELDDVLDDLGAWRSRWEERWLSCRRKRCRPRRVSPRSTVTEVCDMHIQINTDDNITNSDALVERIEATVRDVLERFSDQVTRVEVHLSDENSDKKSGGADIRCLLEARLAGRQPVAVTDEAATLEQAVDGAVRKMRRSLDSTLGRLQQR